MDKKIPDYEGFVKHFETMKDAGCPVDRDTLLELAERYHTPIPYHLYETGDKK